MNIVQELEIWHTLNVHICMGGNAFITTDCAHYFLQIWKCTLHKVGFLQTMILDLHPVLVGPQKEKQSVVPWPLLRSRFSRQVRYMLTNELTCRILVIGICLSKANYLVQCYSTLQSAVYAMVNLSCLSVRHTSVLCQNEGMQRDAVFIMG